MLLDDVVEPCEHVVQELDYLVKVYFIPYFPPTIMISVYDDILLEEKVTSPNDQFLFLMNVIDFLYINLLMLC